AGDSARKLLRHEILETLTIAPEPVGWIERAGPRLEARGALEDVVRPARLAELAVVDDVDAGLGLLRNHFGDRRRERTLMSGFIARQIKQRFGADQAADMRRQDAVVTAFHGHP